MNQPTGIEKLVAQDIAARQALGKEKYGVTLEDNPLSLRKNIQHAYEESLDLPCYLKKLLVELDSYRATFQRLTTLWARLTAYETSVQTDTNGDHHYVIAVECEDYCEIAELIKECQLKTWREAE